MSMDARHHPRPPAAARALIRLLVPSARAELVLGDLEEDFADAVTRDGAGAARRDYWRVALRSVFDGGRWRRGAPPPGMSPTLRTSRPSRIPAEAIMYELRLALRSLLRRPAFTAVTVLTLALAIGASTAAFAVVHHVLLRTPPYVAPHELVTVWKTDSARRTDPAFAEGWNRIGVSLAEIEGLRRAGRPLGDVAGYRTERRILSGIGEPAQALIARATPGLLPLLGVQPQLGRWFGADDGDARVAVISDALWGSGFGRDRAALGRTIQVEGAPYTIIGVLPRRFGITPVSPFMQQGAPALWLPVGLDPYDTQARDYEVVARLQPQTSPSEAAVLVHHLFAPAEAPRRGAGVRVAHRQDIEVAGLRRPLFVLVASVGVFLVLACVNVGALSLGETQARQRELITRQTLGASRARIIGQLLTESMILAIAGAALAIPTAIVVLRTLLDMAPVPLAVAGAEVDSAVLGFVGALALLVTLLFGTAPAWTVARSVTRLSVRGSQATIAGGALRHGLMAVQFALTTVLLVSAALLTRSLLLEQRVQPGFVTADRFVVRVKRPVGRDPEFAARIRARLAEVPGVARVATSGRVPLLEPAMAWHVTRMPHAADDPPVAVALEPVSDDYFRTMGIPIVEGRGIDGRDGAGSPRVAVVSRALAERLWPGQPPIGREVADPMGRYRVIGVAGDVHDVGLDAAPDGVLYAATAQGPLPGGNAFVIHAPGAAFDRLADEARRAVHEAAPGAAVDAVLTLDQVVADAVATDRYRMAIAISFAVLATLMGAVGLAGVVIRDVSRRLRELAIRMALGATAARVARLPIAQVGRSVGVGVALGLAGSLAAGRLLAAYLFGVTPHDPWSIAATIAVLGGIVLSTLAVALRRITTQELAPLLGDSR